MKKLLIIFLSIVLPVPVFIEVTPQLLSWAWNKYDDYCEQKYREEYPNDPATIYLQDTLSGINVVDQIYYESTGDWNLYVQADTREKAELILEKIPELIDYGRSNYKNYDSMCIYCQLDHLYDHFVSCIPSEYEYRVTQNEISLHVEPHDLAKEKTVCEIFESGKFPGITTIYSDIELSDKALDNFPNLKKFGLYNREEQTRDWTYF